MTIQYWVIALFILTRYVTLWPWPSTFRPWNHVTLCHLGVHKPCTKFELDKTYRSRVRTIRICHWFRVSPNLYAFFCRIKGSNFKFYLFCPPKGTTLDRTTHNKQENVSKGAICGRGEETKKGKKLLCVKLVICTDHQRRFSNLKFCVRVKYWLLKVVIYFKFHENRSRGLGAVGVENGPFPLNWLMVYTTACTTVEAVMSHDFSKYWHYFRELRKQLRIVTTATEGTKN